MTQDEALILLAVVVAVFAMVYALLSSRMSLVRQREMEQRLAAQPTTAQLSDITARLAYLEGRQEAVLAEAHGARAAIRRVEDFLLKSTLNPNHDSKF